jgi:hypothetical protein
LPPYNLLWRVGQGFAPFNREFIEHWTVSAFASYVADLEVHATDSPAAEAAWLRIVCLEREFWDIGLSSR